MNAKEIDAKIRELRTELENVSGTQTEVYTRIVGYYRSLKNWNAGKRDEYNHRKTFLSGRSEVHGEYLDGSAACESEMRGANAVIRNSGSGKTSCTAKTAASAANSGHAHPELDESLKKPSAYLLFTRKTCPNCPPVKDFVAGLGLEGTYIDVDTAEGLDAARKYGVLASPTAIFFDGGDEVFRASSVGDLRTRLEARN